MALLGIYGPHAVGKTTAMDRLIDKVEGRPVTIINADNNLERWWNDNSLEEMRHKGRGWWKGKAEGKRALCADLIADDMRLWVLESVRFDTHKGIAQAYQDYDGGAHVIFLVARWDVFESFMIERNEANGREFNYDYWTQSKLAYEGYARYINQAHKYFDPYGVPYDVIEVSHDRHEWSEIDELIWMQVMKPLDRWYNG